jgi:hypothetical protein
VEARFVLMTDMEGVITTDQWVNAREANGTIHGLPQDSDELEWQAYLDGGGTIDAYIEPTLPPNPGPVLKSLHPDSMPIDTAPFELMLWGDNFAFNTVVLFNGEKVNSMFVNTKQILASLSGGTWRTPGDYSVRVVTGEQNVTNRTTDELVFTFTEPVAPPVQPTKGR